MKLLNFGSQRDFVVLENENNYIPDFDGEVFSNVLGDTDLIFGCYFRSANDFGHCISSLIVKSSNQSLKRLTKNSKDSKRGINKMTTRGGYRQKYYKKWYEKNRERKIEQVKEYNRKNRQKKLEYWHQYNTTKRREETNKRKREKKCIVCGRLNDRLPKTNCSVCFEKKREYWRKNRVEFQLRRKLWGRQLKIEAVNICGGKCVICGYNKNYSALEFHHLKFDGQYESYIQSDFLKRIRDGKRSTQDLQLVCTNCHKEIHHPDTQNGNGCLHTSRIS